MWVTTASPAPSRIAEITKSLENFFMGLDVIWHVL
jgi:hypothetical protein